MNAKYQPVRADQFKCRAIGALNELRIEIRGEWGQIFSLDKSSCFGNIGAWQDP